MTARHGPLPRRRCRVERRPSARRRGYNRKWEQARAAFLAQHPVCCMPRCGAPATHVDHIVPHRGNAKLFWRRSNWQPMCASCHSRKTRGEGHRPDYRRRSRHDSQGNPTARNHPWWQER